jgi:hypothetical protein
MIMADIFISYSKKDKLLAEQLAGLLQEVGFTVWWDAELLPTKEFREEIRRQIHAARTVIVIWSENSAKSAFVIDEADLARESGKLISTLADGFTAGGVPLGFRNTHMTSLSDGDTLVRALASRGLATAKPISSFLLTLFRDRIITIRNTRSWLFPAASALLLMMAAGAGAMYALLPVRQEQRAPLDYMSAYLSFSRGQEANPQHGIIGREPEISVSYNYLGSLYIRKARIFLLTPNLEVVGKNEDSTVIYAKSYWGYSMAMGSDAEKALAKNGYISACIDFAKTENAASSTIGMVQKVGEIQMYLDKIQSVQFKAAEASVVAALSKQQPL